jgi:hypothetical protein
VPRPVRSTRELCKASEHVAYEIERLYGTLHDLEALLRARYGGAETSLWTHDALIESWTTHVRNTMHFLRATKPQPNDILARNFFTGSEWQKLLPRRPRDDAEKHIDRRIKEIAHLTYARTKVTPEATSWQMSTITTKVGADMQIFLNHVPMDCVEPHFHRRTLDALRPFAAEA